MRQSKKQQGKKKSTLQPKTKVKYRNLKSNYTRFEEGDFQVNYKSKRKQRFTDEENSNNTSSKSQKNRQRTKINYEYIDDDEDYNDY
ncbi:MAG: hypothetical protein AB8G11_13195 [Saprospiraceae bacterium]